jgi:hypothetical protein
MYKGIAFSPQANLADNVGAADTIIKVSDVSAFPDAPNYATIGTDETGETILYTAKTATALSGCTRGVEGTAKAWTAGELIGRNFTAVDHAALIENVEKVIKNAATAPRVQTITLTASAWAGGVQTVTVAGVSEDETQQLIQTTPSRSSAAAWREAGVYCSGQSANTLQFTASDTPTVDLTAYVVIQELTAVQYADGMEF